MFPFAPNPSRLRVLAAALSVACGLSGCTHLTYPVQHNVHEFRDNAGLTHWPFYHSSKTGEIVPKHSASSCQPYYEPAFYGFAATCWRSWPEGWIGCPIEEVVPAADELEPTSTDAWSALPPLIEQAHPPMLDGMPLILEEEPTLPRIADYGGWPSKNETPTLPLKLKTSPLPPPNEFSYGTARPLSVRQISSILPGETTRPLPPLSKTLDELDKLPMALLPDPDGEQQAETKVSDSDIKPGELKIRRVAEFPILSPETILR